MTISPLFFFPYISYPFQPIFFLFLRLQFKGEIDPGSNDFWNKEINRKYGRETKKISLEVEEEKVNI
jgi:hypothetical protein